MGSDGYDKNRFALGSRLAFGDSEAAEATSVGGADDDANEFTAARNTQTVIYTPVSASSGPALTARLAFESVHLRMLALENSAAGIFVAAVGPHREVVSEVFMTPGQATIVGRHTHCHLRLANEAISLRHLAVHLERCARNTLRTRVWDLQTSTPFRTEDGESASAVVADGPLFLTLGPYVLAFIPLDPAQAKPLRDTDKAWDTMPKRTFSARGDANLPRPTSHSRPTPPSPSQPTPPAIGAPSIQEPQDPRTLITRIPRPTSLFEHTIPPRMVFARIALTMRESTVIHDVCIEDLRRGILIGRYARCSAGAESDDTVSRVHLMIVAIGDAIWAVDTASTNGTVVAGDGNDQDEEIDCTLLGKQHEIYLAAHTILRWSMVARAAA